MFMDPAQGRWVCPRCFESNEADADRCVKCDLERGADPAAAAATAPGAAAVTPGTEGAQPAPTGPGGSWTPPPAPESNRPGWLQLVLRFWWVGLLVIGGGIAAFNYLGGSRPVTDMSVGECFDVADPDSEFIDDVTQRDCTEPHQFEMFYVGDLPDGSFPSDDEVFAWVQANCIPAFSAYVGIDYQTSVLEALPITPTEDGWNDGDHSVQCAMHDPGNPQLTESQKDAAR
ncbi:MAG TPA: septum formation family protein [Candidatus Limnocylindria bacterium]|nr:septum formation family protein [Candidatus Limnocylindria bacterium]